MDDHNDDEPRNGEYGRRYLNGHLERQAFYKNGKLEGWCRFWYANGKIWEKKFYRGGHLEGEYRFWDRDGVERSYCYFKDAKFWDLNFNRKKKNGFLSVKRRLQILPDFGRHLIPDLSRMVC